MRLAELQRRMQRNVLDGGADPALLAELDDPPEQRERRLAVYRNNVRHALLGVLDAAFPVIRQLLGAECFTATGLAFIAARPPRQPALYAYGAALANFLADFEPLAKLPWLADMARLEWARNEALFAADHQPLTPIQLAAVPGAELSDLQLALHPSAQVLESPWPIHAIWDAHQPDGGLLEAVDLGRAETVLVWRRDGSVRQRPLAGGEFALLAAFAARRPLAEAAAEAAEQDSLFDLSIALAALLSGGVLVREACEPPERPPHPTR